MLEFEDMVEVDTPLGRGRAIFVEATARDNYWTIQLYNGAFVTFPQKKIRGTRNYTSGLGIDDKEMKDIIA
jgi:hypothetical protein